MLFLFLLFESLKVIKLLFQLKVSPQTKDWLGGTILDAEGIFFWGGGRKTSLPPTKPPLVLDKQKFKIDCISDRIMGMSFIFFREQNVKGQSHPMLLYYVQGFVDFVDFAEFSLILFDQQ